MAEPTTHRAEDRARPRADAPQDPLGRRAWPSHVLVVDDNEMNLLVARSFCQVLGFTWEAARSGPEAIEAVRHRRFDLILMDICMPGMDGVETTRLIRDLPGPSRTPPIIAVTANADRADIASYLGAGMCSVVAKPIEVGQLFEAIEHALANERNDPFRR